MKFQYVQDSQFCDQLGRIEPKARQQLRLLEAVEHACDDRIKRADALGIGFVVVSWGQNWIVWYETDGCSVVLQSIRPDLRKSTS